MNPQDFWNQRYSKTDYAYGEQPNEFLADQLPRLPKGRILFPAEGEGRNAVYAAKLGWQSVAFDQSTAGQEKAIRLAAKNDVSIEYSVCNALLFTESNSFDAIAFCYFHTPPQLLNPIYSHLLEQLKPGGTVLLEGFSEKNLGLGSGGPQDLAMLFSTEKIAHLFQGLKNLRVWEEQVVLNEGKYHQGNAWVIRAIAEK